MFPCSAMTAGASLAGQWLHPQVVLLFQWDLGACFPGSTQRHQRLGYLIVSITIDITIGAIAFFVNSIAAALFLLLLFRLGLPVADAPVVDIKIVISKSPFQERHRCEGATDTSQWTEFQILLERKEFVL